MHMNWPDVAFMAVVMLAAVAMFYILHLDNKDDE